MRFVKLLRVIFLATALAVPTVAVTSGSVFAYGHADHPLAQVEISGNCDNPGFWLCAPEDQGGVGIGGIWLWVEIDANGTADVAGAVCGHTIGGPRGGAGSIKGEMDWIYGSAADAAGLGIPTFGFVDDQYYIIPALGFAVPVTTGHYAFHPVAGVSLQIQVAP